MASKLKVEIEASAQDFISNMGKAAKSVDDVKKQTDKAAKSVNDLGNSTNSTSRSFASLSNEEKRATVEALNHERATRQQAKAIKEAQKELKEMQSSLSGIGSSISGAFRSLQSGDLMGFTDSIKNAGINFKNLSMGANTGKGALSALSSSFTSLGSSITTALGPLGIAAASVAAVTAVTYKAVQANQEYHASLGEFSALTGMVGADLDDMGDRARDMAVKFGSSAPEILNSMKLIGSQAPILLKDADAMEQVTDSAIVLSKASKMSIEDSARGITTIINQMGADVNESKEIINSLAAGSKEGAGDVNYLSTAIEKSGTVAAGMGLSYQQLIGTIETLAPKFSSAEVAGTALKGTLLKLSTQSNSDFNPAVVGLSTALENLAKANLSDAELTKLVGEANITATKTLIDERSEVNRLTNAVTGTNTAFEQMEAQGGLLSQTWDKLCASVNDLWIELGETNEIQAVIGFIGGLIDVCKLLVDGLKYLVKTVNTVREIVFAAFKKLYDYCVPYIRGLYEAITKTDAFKFMKEMWNGMVEVATNAITKVKDLYRRFMQWLGLQKEDMNINATVKTKKDVKGEYQKSLLAEQKRKAEEEAKKKAEAAEKARLKAEKDAQKKSEEQEKKAEEKRINDIASLQEELLRKKNLKERYITLKLNTDSLERDIAKIEEKLKKLGANGDFTGLEEFKTKMTKKIQDMYKDTNVKVDLSGLSVDEITQMDSDKTKQVDADTKKAEKEAADKERDAKKKEAEIAKKKSDEARAYQEYKSAIEDYSNAYVDKVDIMAEHTNTIISLISDLKQLDKDGAGGWAWIETISNGLAEICNQIVEVIQSFVALGAAKQAYAAIASDANNKEAMSASSATAANVGKAMSGAASSASSLPFPANIAAILASVAAVLSVIGMIASAANKAKKHAGGGIIGGSTHIGDSILARVNAGEMILNQRQQKHMFNMLDKGSMQRNSAPQELSFKLKGEDIVGAIKNYNNKHR